MALGFNFRYYYIVSLGFLPFILNQTTDTELYYCVDWNCEEFISRGKTLLSYIGKTDKHLSFRQNEDIKILAKPVDINAPDWFGTVRRKVGLVPKSMLREDQINSKRSSTFKYPLNQLPIWPQPGEENISVPAATTNDTGQLEEEDNHLNDTDIPIPPTVTESLAVDEKVESDSGSEAGKEEDVEQDGPITDPTEILPGLEDTSEDNLTLTKANSESPVEDDNISVSAVNLSSPLDTGDSLEPPTPTETSVELPLETDSETIPIESVAVEDKSEAGKEQEDLEKETEAGPATDPTEVVNENEPEKIETNGTEIEPVESSDATTESPALPVETEQVPEEEQPADANLGNFDAPVPVDVTVDAKDDKDHSAQKLSPETDSSATIPIESFVKEEKGEGGKEQEDPTTDPTELVNESEKIETTGTENESHDHDDVTTESPNIPPKKVSSEGQSADIISENLSTDHSHLDASPNPVEVEAGAKDEIDQSEQEIPLEKDFGIYGIPIEPVVAEEKGETGKDQEDSEKEVNPVTDPTELVNEPEKIETTGTENESHGTTTESPASSEVEQVPVEEQLAEVNLENLPTVDSPNDAPFTNSVDVDVDEQSHSHDDHHHHDHHHTDSEDKKTDSSSFIIIAKHLSSTLLSFLPEHLQDTILDVDDALVFTGIIALTLVSICVPYFLIEGFFSVRPLKKKVVELNKSLWKVSTAYENQQEEYEQYKKKALAYDEDKRRVEQLEYELSILKKLEGKQKEQVVKYQKELKNHKELTQDMQSFLDKEVEKKKKILEEKEKLKTNVTSLKEALRRTVDDLQDTQAQSSTTVMELELEKQSNETLSMKCSMLEREVGELRNKLVAEVDRRRAVDNEKEELERVKSGVENDLTSLKQICQQYEDTVSALNTEISNKENELLALQETLGEDSPLLDIAEMKGKLLNVEELLSSLQHRLDSTTLENASLSRNLKEATGSLSSTQKERDENANRLAVLEAWFKEKEEDLRRAVERYEAEKNIRGKDKDELVQMLEDKGEENRQLHNKLDEFKVEFEETKLQHKNEIRAMETKSHEHWLSLCQAERKAQDARKEAEMLRQKLTAITKEKEGDGINGDESTAMYPLITPDMVPIPLPDDVPSYFGLGDGFGFMPPPPLPLDDDDREVHRPAPLGRVSPTYSDLEDPISPIRGGGGRDYSDGGQSSASDSPRRRPSPRRRGGSGWSSQQRDRQRQDMEDARHRDFVDRRPGPVTTSSPIQGGFNL